jgi:hypothetical protein
MLEHLFGSKTRYNLLRIFFREPGIPWFVRELTRELDSQINAIRRELAVLLKLGIVVEVEEKDNQSRKKFYQLDKASLIYPELQALLLKAQVLGEQAFIEEIKDKGGDIKLFLLCGHFTGGEDVGSDMLLVGKLKERSVPRLVSKYEKEFGFSIRYTLMTKEEFFERRHLGDKFIYALFEAKHLLPVNELEV